MPLLLLIYALNTAYLAAFASPTMFYFAQRGLPHRRWHRPERFMWIRLAGGDESGTVFLSRCHGARGIASGILATGLAFGLLITVVGAAGRWRWLLPVHIALSLAGAVPLLISARLPCCDMAAARERRLVTAACAIAVLAAHRLATGGHESSARAKSTNMIRNPSIVPFDDGRRRPAARRARSFLRRATRMSTAQSPRTSS